MEHIEQRDGSLHGVGAYTVLRCDAIYNKDVCQWKIWGLDFHMNRLCSSYRMLVESLGNYTCDEHGNDLVSFRSIFQESKQQTDDLITVLLGEAKKSIQLRGPPREDHTDVLEGRELARTLMVTILWTPPDIGSVKPIVRGHAAFAGAASPIENKDASMPSSISACLGIPSDPTPEELALLPRRHSDDDNGKAELVGASAKVSSWCRIRRPLEERFKAHGSGVGEVLLVRQDKSGLLNNDQQDFIEPFELLEGLTSNLFVVYKNGTVRTAPLGKVLPGYARHLVAEELNNVQSANSASSLGELVLDETNAPTVLDAKLGLWSEVFVTSAIRLVVPVHRVLIPPVGDSMESVTLWQLTCDEHCAPPLTHSIWSAVNKRGYKLASSR